MVSQSVNTEYFLCIYTYLQTPTDFRAGNLHITGPDYSMDWSLCIDLNTRQDYEHPPTFKYAKIKLTKGATLLEENTTILPKYNFYFSYIFREGMPMFPNLI